MLLFGKDRYDDAIVEFEKAIEIDPDYLEAQNSLAIVKDKKIQRG